MSEPALRAPGLYLRALESEPALLAPTAVTAFVGVTERGPLNSPQAVRSWGEYLEVFGGAPGPGFTADGINAFFLNGGEKAYVVRVGRDLPDSPPATCQTSQPLAIARSSVTIPDANGLETLRLLARNEGSWGNRLQARFRADAGREMVVASLT